MSHCGYNSYLTTLHWSCDIKSQYFSYVLSLSIYFVVLVPIHPAVMHCIKPVTFSDNNHITRDVHFASRKCKTFPRMSLVVNVEICSRVNTPRPSSPPKFFCSQWRIYIFKVALTAVFPGRIFAAVTHLTAVPCGDEELGSLLAIGGSHFRLAMCDWGFSQT